ncbi:hypothetical protein CON84_25380 [Bacillus sp. AFS094228]|nr:hypothetical protein CON84_25380 [Bacillus sp. AFS094228]
MHPAKLILKGKFFPSLKRWREVVDNNRGFKGKSEILIKDYHVYNVFYTAIYFTYMDINAAKVKT